MLSLKFYFHAGPKLKNWYLEFLKSKMNSSKIWEPEDKHE